MDILTSAIVMLSFLLSGLFLVHYKRFNDSEKRFGYYILISTFFEILSWCTRYIFELSNNLFGLHAFTLLEFITISNFMLYCFKLFGIELPRNWIINVGSFLIVVNTLFIQNIDTYNSYSISTVKIFIIALCISFFYLILGTKKYSVKEVRPSLYFSTAVFLNASTVMIYYLYSNELINLNDSLWSKLEILKHTSTIIASLIILIGYYHIINRKENDLI